jgi:peptide/nickel transport system permease protein
VATVADAVLALPALPLYMLVIAFVGPSQPVLVLVLALLAWPASARMIRAQVVAVQTASHVEAASALGATRWRILLRHVLPATLSLLPVTLMLNVRYAIFAEATLAFLGLGDPGNPSWGTALAWAFADPLLLARPTWLWWILPPALSIVIVVVAVTSIVGGLGTTVRRSRGPADDTVTPTPRTGHEHPEGEDDHLMSKEGRRLVRSDTGAPTAAT